MKQIATRNLNKSQYDRANSYKKNLKSVHTPINHIKFGPSPSSVLKILAEAYIFSTEYKMTNRSPYLMFSL